MNKLDEQIRCIRESCRALTDPDMDADDKMIEVSNTLDEIASTFEMLLDRLRDLSR